MYKRNGCILNRACKVGRAKGDNSAFGMILPLIQVIVAIVGLALAVIGAAEFDTNGSMGLMHFGAGITLLGFDVALSFKSHYFAIAGAGGLVLVVIGYLGANVGL
jgi:hypothetical protein